MSDLKNPTLENERTSDNPNAACGPAAVASIVNDAGIAVTVSQVNDWMVSTLGNTSQGVPQAWNSAALNHWGIPNRIRTEPMATVQQSATNAGHETIVWHQCDPLTNPVPRGTTAVSHYRTGYGKVVTMSPWGGVLSDQNCAIGDMGRHIEVMMVLPKDGGQLVWNLGMKREKARSWYQMYCGRDPENQAAEDYWANAIANDGSNLDSVAFAFLSTAEAVAWRSKLRAAVLNPTTADPAVAARLQKIGNGLALAGSALSGASQ